MTEGPKHSEAWYQGYDACCRGVCDTHNPHDLEADEIAHMDWNDGFAAANDDLDR